MNHHHFSTTQTQLTQHRKRSFVVTGPMLLELLSPPIYIHMLICLVSDMRNHLYVRVYSYFLNVKFRMISCIRMYYFGSNVFEQQQNHSYSYDNFFNVVFLVKFFLQTLFYCYIVSVILLACYLPSMTTCEKK